MCKTTYFICDLVSVTKILPPLQAKIKYLTLKLNSLIKQFNILFLLEEVAIFFHRNRVANKILNFAHLYLNKLFTLK